MTDAFLAELEGLTHAARQKRMVDLGRASKDDPTAKAQLDALAASADAYGRTLVVASLYGSRDGARALALCNDPSRSVRLRVARAVPIVCDDAQATEALARSSTSRTRNTLARALRRRRRLAPIDAFFANAVYADDKTLVDTLPFASASVVDAAWKTLDETGSPTAWARLVKMHSARFAKWIMEASRELGDARVRWRLHTLVRIFAKRDPAAGLALLRQLLDVGEEPMSATVRTMVPFLLRKFPRETFDAVRARHERGLSGKPPGALGIMRLDRVAHRLGGDRLAYVIEHAWTTLSDGKRAKRWFLRLSEADRESVLRAWLTRGRGAWGAFLLRHVAADGPRAKEREQAFERWSDAAQDRQGIIALVLLAMLPADLRHREARRHFALKALSTKPDERNPYASLLPFEEARTTLASFLGHPEGEERAKADRALIGCVLHEPAATALALAFVRARKFEQDPVRLAMLDALAALPASRFAVEHLEDAGAIVADALDAADCSTATAAAAERLVVRLFRIDATWGAKWLTTILTKRGSISASGVALVDHLLPSDVERLAPALEELASSWCTQERSGALLWLGRALGLRVAQVPALLDAFELLSVDQPFVAVASSALDLLRQHAPQRFAALVPQLLAKDPSYVLLQTVATFVSVHRQDLLAPLVDGRPMTGRYASGRTSWAIAFARGHSRWTRALHGAHAASWTSIIADQKRDVPTVARAIGELASLAFAPRDALLPFASDPRQPVRETTIRALPWLDEGQGVPTLIECLGDERARWAIYALRKAFSEMPRERVLGYLRGAPTSKITVAKEVVRLLGELGGKDSYAELLVLDQKPDLHRDVRIALLRALWDHLERDDTWPVFERAVAHPDWVVASKLADVPLGRLSATSQERVIALLVTILGRPEPEARLDLLRRSAHLPVTDSGRTLLRAILERVGAPREDEALAAAQSVITRMSGTETELVLERLRLLAPRRELFLALLPAFTPNRYSPAHVRTIAESIVTLLARDPLATVPYVTFAGKVLGWRELVAVLEDLGARDFLHSDAMMAAYDAVGQCVHPAAIETKLAHHDNPRLRRLAVEALRHAARPQHGWSRERRAKLEKYRLDRAPLVAAAAAYIFPPERAEKDEPVG